MKRFSNIRILALTIFLLLGAVSAAAVERPFALRGKGTATFITDGSGNIIGGNLTASGTATHLGRWTAVGTVHFTPVPDNPTLFHASGSSTYTAANGDKLDLVLDDGTLDVTTAISTGHAHFTGGTGRFAGASGSISYVVTQNLTTGEFELTAVGRIDY
jgi:hypothetical protein